MVDEEMGHELINRQLIMHEQNQESIKQNAVLTALNLQALVVAASKRADDLALAETRRINEIIEVRSEYEQRLTEAESKRLDAIRVVDAGAVAVASERASEQATVLANQVALSADTLRALVATTATTVAASQQQVVNQLTAAQGILANQLNERLQKVEQSQYEGKGRAGVSDPLMGELMTEMRKTSTAISESKGRSGLSSPLIATIALLVGGIMVFIAEQFLRMK